MQSVKYSKIAEVKEICAFIIPILVTETGVLDTNNSTTVCSASIPDLSDVLKHHYGVRVDVQDAIQKTVGEVAEIVHKQLREKLECDVITVISEVTFNDQIHLPARTPIESLCLDSLTTLDLAGALEDAFSVTITEQDMFEVVTFVPEAQQIKTIDDMVEFIANRLPKKE